MNRLLLGIAAGLLLVLAITVLAYCDAQPSCSAMPWVPQKDCRQ